MKYSFFVIIFLLISATTLMACPNCYLDQVENRYPYLIYWMYIGGAFWITEIIIEIIRKKSLLTYSERLFYIGIPILLGCVYDRFAEGGIFYFSLFWWPSMLVIILLKSRKIKSLVIIEDSIYQNQEPVENKNYYDRKSLNLFKIMLAIHFVFIIIAVPIANKLRDDTIKALIENGAFG